MPAPSDVPPFSRGGLATYRKVILLEAIIVSSFSFWLFKEYQNNRYLQDYVRSKIPTHLPLLDVVGVLVIVIAGVGLHYGLRRPRTVGRQIAEASSRDAQGSGMEVAAASVMPSSVSVGGAGQDQAPIFTPMSMTGELVDPPVLTRIAPPPGLKPSRSEPRPFPVIVRIEPPEEPIEDKQPVAPQTILKRIAPTQSTKMGQSSGAIVRRVDQEASLQTRSVWMKRPEAGSVQSATKVGAPPPKNPTFSTDKQQQGSARKNSRKKREDARPQGPSQDDV